VKLKSKTGKNRHQ